MGALACKTKIILDGRSVAGYAEAICDAVQDLSADQIDFIEDKEGYAIINQLITAERALQKAHNLLLDAMGYNGPRPHNPSAYDVDLSTVGFPKP